MYNFLCSKSWLDVCDVLRGCAQWLLASHDLTWAFSNWGPLKPTVNSSTSYY